MRHILSIFALSLIGCALAFSQGIGGQAGIGGKAGLGGGPSGAVFAALTNSPSSLGDCTGTGTTCSLTLASSLPAGAFAYIHCLTSTSGYAALQSVNVGGTLVPIYSATGVGDDNVGWSADAYIASTTSTAGPMVFTFTVATGGAECYVRPYSVSSGTPLLDWAFAEKVTATGTTQAGLTPVYTGTTDLAIQNTVGESTFSTKRDCSSVTVYGNSQCDSTNGPGAADLINTTSTSAPTWTYNGTLGFAHLGGAAFSTTASAACNDVDFMTWSNSTNGTTATAALANSGNLGYPITGASTAQPNGWAGSTGTLTAMTYETASPPALHAAIRPCGSGSSSTGSTSFAMQYSFSATTAVYLSFGYLGSGTLCSFGGYINTTYAGTDTNNHDIKGCGLATDNYVTAQVVGTGSATAIQIECNGGGGTTNFSSQVTISTSTWYWVTAQDNTASGGQFEVCTDSHCGTVVGSGSCTASGWTAGPPTSWQIGQGGSTGDHPSTVIQYANDMFSAAGTYPLITN